MCLGKDLEGATQEKIIQAMGRVGRGAFQHTYSLRFRNNEMIKKLFKEEKDKPEVIEIGKDESTIESVLKNVKKLIA